MHKYLFLVLLALLFQSCSKDYPYDELDFNLYGGVGRTNAFEHFGTFPLQLTTDEQVDSEDSSGIINAPLRLKTPYTIIATTNGNILRLNNNSKDKQFHIDSSFVVATGMAADRNSNVYFIDSDDNLYALSIELVLKWKKHLPIPKSRALSYSDLLATKDGIYVGANSGDLIKFDLDGNISWHYKSSYAIGKTFAADSSGNIYLPLTNNTFGDTDSIACLDKSGKLLWQTALDGTRILSSTAYKNGRIYATGAKTDDDEKYGATFCLDKSGKILWSAESTIPGRNVAVDFEGICYVTSTSTGVGEISTGVLAYDNDGKEIWKVYFGMAAISSPIISDKYIGFTAFTGEGAAMIFVRKSDGLLVRSHSLSNLPPLYLQPMVADDATIKLYGTNKLHLIKFTETSLNKFLP